MSTSKEIQALREAFDESCDAIANLETQLANFQHLKQFMPKPLRKTSASEKMRIARDILKLMEN